MIGRLSALAIGLASGLLLALSLVWAMSVFQQPAMSSGQSQVSTSAPERDAGAGSTAKLTANAIEAAGIAVSNVRSGTIARRIIVPGSIVPQADRIAHVAVKLSSIVAELRK